MDKIKNLAENFKILDNFIISSPDVILFQFGQTKNIKAQLLEKDKFLQIIEIPDFVPDLLQKYNLKKISDVKKLQEEKLMDFVLDIFVIHFDSILSRINANINEFNQTHPIILIVNRSFVDLTFFIFYLNHFFYELNSIFLYNYNLFNLIEKFFDYSFIKGIVNLPDLNDKDSIFISNKYKNKNKNYLESIKNYLSYINYLSTNFSHLLPINYHLYSDLGDDVKVHILDYEIEHTVSLFPSPFIQLVEKLPSSKTKQLFYKYLLSRSPKENILENNYVWGQIIPTIIHFYNNQSKFFTVKEKNILLEELNKVFNNSTGYLFLSIVLRDVITIATLIRQQKQQHIEKVYKINEPKYIN